MTNNDLIMEKVFNHPIAKVWQAISDVEHMRKWYFDLAEFKAELGFEFSFLSGCNDNGDQYLHLCKVLEVEEGKKLTYTWSYKEYEGMSQVTFELFEIENGTKLVLTHKGLETFPQSIKDFGKESFVSGWTHYILNQLPNYLDAN